MLSNDWSWHWFRLFYSRILWFPMEWWWLRPALHGGVLWSLSTWCSQRGLITLLWSCHAYGQLQRRDVLPPPHTWQAHYKSCLLQKEKSGLPPVPPHSWASQKDILSVCKTYWKAIRMAVMNRVNVSSDKAPNDILYSWFGILSPLLLCSAGGTSNIVRWL